MADFIPVSFVAEDGTVYKTFDAFAVAPEPQFEGELFAGGTAAGNEVISIPEGAAGVLRVGLGSFGDEVFVAVQ